MSSRRRDAEEITGPQSAFRHTGARHVRHGERHGAFIAAAVRRELPGLHRLLPGAIRISALMRVPVLYIWTHDSINLGEDGPTHQPIGQLAALRAMPGMIVFRPADANEVVEAYRVIMQIKDRPVSLVLSRQPLPTFDRTIYAPASGVAKGAYILADAPREARRSAARHRQRGVALPDGRGSGWLPKASAREW